MKREELTAALRRMKVETGSLVCLSCGYERGCGVHGCRVLREAAELLEEDARQMAALRRDVHGLRRLVMEQRDESRPPVRS